MMASLKEEHGTINRHFYRDGVLVHALSGPREAHDPALQRVVAAVRGIPVFSGQELIEAVLGKRRGRFHDGDVDTQQPQARTGAEDQKRRRRLHAAPQVLQTLLHQVAPGERFEVKRWSGHADIVHLGRNSSGRRAPPSKDSKDDEGGAGSRLGDANAVTAFAS
jgi:hypothetical protein